MLFAKRTAAKENSADKKARQEKRWVFPAALLFCVLFVLLGGAFAFFRYGARRFGDDEVAAYVRSLYGPSWSLQKKGGSDNAWNLELPWERAGEETVSYLYAAPEGGSFSVYTMAVPELMDGVPTGRYSRALYDNYFATVIENNMDKIRALADSARQDAGLELSVERVGTAAGGYGAEYVFRLYLTENAQLEAAADLLSRLDGLLSFACGQGEGPYAAMRGRTPSAQVYLMPEKSGAAADAVSAAASRGAAPSVLALRTDWRSPNVRDLYRISEVAFSSFTEAEPGARLTGAGLAARLENDYVDAAKTTGKSAYAVSDALWDKYPAPVLTLVNAGGHDLPEEGGFSYRLLYHRRTGIYWMEGLDPCEDFDGSPAGAYSRQGAFAQLVRYLGGTYSCGTWTADWRIGQVRWKASLETGASPASPYAYRGFSLTRDGSAVLLDAVPEVFAGTGATPSGRPFSIRDLIRMLDARITVNQKSMTAVMFRDIADE